MARKENEKHELEELRLDLHLQEQEEAARKLESSKLQYRIQKRLELIQAYHDQIADKKAKIEREREEEEVYRERMLQQFAVQEKIEQMNAQKRRMKQLEHKRAVEAMIIERQQMIDQDAVLEKEISQREKELEDYRDQVIEQERQRLLLEHAKPLAGYLPKVTKYVLCMYRVCFVIPRIWTCLIKSLESSLKRSFEVWEIYIKRKQTL